MKRLIPSVLMLLAASCVPNDSSIRLLQGFSLIDPPSLTGTVNTCDTANAFYQYSGSYDLSASFPNQQFSTYLLRFPVENNLAPLSFTTPNGAKNSGSEQNDFITDRYILTYTATALDGGLTTANLGLTPEHIPAYFLVPAGATGPTSFVQMDLLGPRAINTLRDAGQITTSNGIYVNVGVQLSGTLASGAPTVSNTANYPIYIYRSGFNFSTCTTKIALNGPCGRIGGQDGAPITCCPPPTSDAGFPGC